MPAEFGKIPVIFRGRNYTSDGVYQEMREIYSTNNGDSYEIWFEYENKKWTLNFKIASAEVSDLWL